MDAGVKRKLYIAVGAFLLISVLLVVIALFNQPKQSLNTSGDVPQNSYIDPDTGEEVLSPEGKAPELIENPTGVIILGSSKLVDYGITSSQLELYQEYIKSYIGSRESSSRVDELSIVVSTIVQKIDATSGMKTLSFDIKINKQTLERVVLTYYQQTDLFLSIYDSAGTKELFYAPAGG